MALAKKCQCGKSLVFYVRAGCWLCPEVEDTPLAGLIEPRESAIVRRELPTPISTPSSWAPWTTLALNHVTCMPAEFWDEDFEVTPGHQFARTGSMKKPEDIAAMRETERREHRRTGAKESIAKLPPHGPGSREQLGTFSCSDCGYRTPSDNAMMEHLRREGHGYGESPSGKRVQPSASTRTRPVAATKEARRAASRNAGGRIE